MCSLIYRYILKIDLMDITRRNFIKNTALGAVGLAVSTKTFGFAGSAPEIKSNYVSLRPAVADRKFTSQAVEETIKRVKSQIQDPKLAWMFENCFPNTLDTTVTHKMRNNKPDTFVITGDIHAMWLRDSTAQVWPYLQLMNKDKALKNMIKGLIYRQSECICIDSYANAFNDGPLGGHWQSDFTDMKPELHERKWEIDSLCYTVRLAYRYWILTGDTSIFDEKFIQSSALIYKTFIEQQRKENLGPYKFQRTTETQTDTLSNRGWGNPVNPVGMIVSSFRPSDDATIFGFLVPSNLFAIRSLRQLYEIHSIAIQNKAFAQKCEDLAKDVEAALKKHAIVDHPKYGKIYAFEVDGFGGQNLMDDANIPSLLALPYLGCVDKNDPIYKNTRNFVWSKDNPYFFSGKAGEGIGGPHIGFDFVWPMSIIMKALTSTDDKEIADCIKMLRNTDADTGFMHESFHKDNPSDFTRKWFAWVNTLFGELIVKLVDEGKSHLLK